MSTVQHQIEVEHPSTGVYDHGNLASLAPVETIVVTLKTKPTKYRLSHFIPLGVAAFDVVWWACGLPMIPS